MTKIRTDKLKKQHLLLAAFLASWFFCALLPHRVIAEVDTTKVAPQVVTLEGAWSLAAKYNQDLQIAQQQVVVADGKVREAWAGALPNVSASGQYQRNIESPVFYISMTDTSGNSFTQAFKIGEKNAYTGVLSVQQPLWLAGKIGLGLKAAKLYRHLSQETLRAQGVQLRYQVANDFYGVLLTKSLLDVARESYDLSVKHATQVHSLYDQGQVSEYDVIRADVAAANQQPQVLQAENQLHLAENALKSLLGLNLNSDVEFSGELVPIERESPATSSVYDIALVNRPEQQSIDLQKQLNKVQYTAESRNVYWPNLYLSAAATWQTEAPDFRVDDYQWNRSISASLQVSIPLFDGFATSARKQQVRAQGREIMNQQIQFKDGLKLEIQGIIDNIQTANERLDAQKKTVAQAERGLKIAEVRYENGISTLLEVLDAQLALSVAKTEYLKSVYNQRIAFFALDRAEGRLGLTPEDTKE
jgi:outer membrane protein